MFENMLQHPNIKVMLNTDYKEIYDAIKFSRLVYTGPIDEFYSFKHGELPYRSLRFEFQTLQYEYHQSVGTVNYPNEYDFTRITEQKYLSGQKNRATTLITEYPQPHITGVTDAYYPIINEENRKDMRPTRRRQEILTLFLLVDWLIISIIIWIRLVREPLAYQKNWEQKNEYYRFGLRGCCYI